MFYGGNGFPPHQTPQFIVGRHPYADMTWRLKDLGESGPLWQNRFYDHIIRDDADFGRHLDYVHFNPVKHGYVSQPKDYRWSTFRQWVERGVYTED